MRPAIPRVLDGSSKSRVLGMLCISLEVLFVRVIQLCLVMFQVELYAGRWNIEGGVSRAA
jgi:hypothetical protein